MSARIVTAITRGIARRAVVASALALAAAPVAHAQECRLDYQRGTGATGVEQLLLGTGQDEAFVTDARFAGVRGTTTTRYGSDVRFVANRGTAPLALALVGRAMDGRSGVPGGTVVRAMGGLTGGVLRGNSAQRGTRGHPVSGQGGLAGGVVASNAAASGAIIDPVVAAGGAAGGVVNTVAAHVAAQGGSWFVLQPGEIVAGLRDDVSGVACGASHPVLRAVAAMLSSTGLDNPLLARKSSGPLHR